MFAPMPSASERIATKLKPGERRSVRKPNRASATKILQPAYLSSLAAFFFAARDAAQIERGAAARFIRREPLRYVCTRLFVDVVAQLVAELVVRVLAVMETATALSASAFRANVWSLSSSLHSEACAQDQSRKRAAQE